MGPSLDIYSEIAHLPLVAVMALVCVSTEDPGPGEAPSWESTPEVPTERPEN
jgi:hypothetical protein